MGAVLEKHVAKTIMTFSALVGFSLRESPV